MLFFNKAKRNSYWKNITQKDWLDWKWQLKNRVTNPDDLGKIIGLKKSKIEEIKKSLKILRMAITPYYLSQIDSTNKNDPIFIQSIPNIEETHIAPEEKEDPLYEEIDTPSKELQGVLTHRYPDRCIVYVTYQCVMYCRHCTRRRHAGETDLPTPWEKLVKAAEYIKKTKRIKDVLLSGGDPFTLSTSDLEKITKLFSSIKSLNFIRFGTRTPVTCPMRIDDELCDMLKKYHPIYVNTHFNHPHEMTDLASRACNKLADAGIPLGNQSVLLKGVNNNPETYKQLVYLLLANRVKPYYLYACDLSQGLSHVRTRVCEGIDIIENLRGHVTGFGVPTFIIDGIGGAGKVPIAPNYVLSQGKKKWVLRNYKGQIFEYIEPY
jgi:lysine 2,3-aminomutase